MKRFVLLFCLAALAGLSVLQVQAAPTTLGQACPLLSHGPLAAARLADLPAGTLLRAGTVSITSQDISSEISSARRDVRDQLKNNHLQVLEQLAVKRLLAQEAGQWAQKTNREAKENEDARVQAYLASVTAGVKVTEADVQRAYNENKDSFGGAKLEDVAPQLTPLVLTQQRDAALQRYTNGLSERIPVDVAETWVRDEYRHWVDNPVDKARLSGLPSMIDFGASGCMACETMAPILTRLETSLKGQINVLFIDVRKEPALAARFGVKTIPLQVFFDKNGQELFRHVGVFAEPLVRAKMTELGFK